MEHDWDRSRDGLGGEGCGGASGDYDIGLALGEFGGKAGESLVSRSRKPADTTFDRSSVEGAFPRYPKRYTLPEPA
jgi:hypothetical protein